MANPSNAPTACLLDEAGIGPGMRVLDVGCAMGLLTRELAARVGPGGSVLGIDVERERLEEARAAPAPEGGGAIDYAQVDLMEPLPDLGRFDAIVGRRVLMYLPDPAAALGGLARLLQPGGVMAWHEHAGVGAPVAAGPLPAHARAHALIWDTVTGEGGHRALGLELPRLLRGCGLAVSSYRVEAVVIGGEGGGGIEPGLKGMFPRMVATGVAPPDEAALEALCDQTRREREALGGPIIWDFACLATGRLEG